MGLCDPKPGPKTKKLRKVGGEVKVGFENSAEGYDRDDLKPLSRVCLICLRRYEESRKEGEGKRLNLYLRFLQIVSRHLNIRTKRFRTSALQSDLILPSPFCVECGGIVEKLCEAYEELQKVKLMLTWRLSQISSLVSNSTLNVSGKLGSSLLRNLSRQLRIMSVTRVDHLRKQFVLKCSAKVNSSPPKVTIKKLTAGPRLQYSFEVMEQFLKCLIVVFALSLPSRQKGPVGPKEVGTTNSTGQGQADGSRTEVASSKPPEEVVPLKMERDDEESESESGEGYNSHFEGEGAACSPEQEPEDAEDQDWDADDAGSGGNGGSDSEWSPNAGSGGDSDIGHRARTRQRRSIRKRKARSCDSNYLSDEGDNDVERDDGSTLSKSAKVRERTTCELCKGVLSTRKLYRMHLRTVHEKKGDALNHFCPHCHKGFTFPQTLHEHLQASHRKKLEIQCDAESCRVKFTTTESLLEHLKASHFLSPSEEGVVEEVTVDLNYTIPQGKIDCEPEPGGSSSRKLYLCGFCKWPFTSQPLLRVHMITHTPPTHGRQYHCPPCQKKFGRVERLVQHFNLVHGPNINTIECIECGKKYPHRRSYLEHLPRCKNRQGNNEGGTTESGSGCGGKRKIVNRQKQKAEKHQRTYKCSECGSEFLSSGSLYSHRHRVHILTQCDQCEVKMSRPSLIHHKIKMHGMKTKYQCEVCQQCFSCKLFLNRHVVVHEEKKLQCHLCPQRFWRPQHLNEHLKLHTGVKDYVCDFCGRGFATQGALTYHLAIHKGLMNFSCSFCGKKFRRKFTRNQHERTHTKEKPYVCKYCARAFSNLSSLKTHERTHERLNSDQVVRRPWRPTVGVGNPLSREEEAASVSASGSGVMQETVEET